ncbi:MAG: hypothetical protein A07HN63_01517 [uncultured archaeon A07HN63]|nr:MAG: hypothetical protein A07HN63_01517 [uncultured archaeon A07HN63]
MLVGGVDDPAVERPLREVVILQVLGEPIQLGVEADRDDAIDAGDAVSKAVEERSGHLPEPRGRLLKRLSCRRRFRFVAGRLTRSVQRCVSRGTTAIGRSEWSNTCSVTLPMAALLVGLGFRTPMTISSASIASE